MQTSSTAYNKPCVVEYVVIYHTEDCPVGVTGLSTHFTQHPVTHEDNPPTYLKGDIKEVKEHSVSFCCRDMGAAWRHSLIGFGEGFYNKQTDVFFRTQPFNCAIRFCPFCTQPIQMVRKASINKPKISQPEPEPAAKETMGWTEQEDLVIDVLAAKKGISRHAILRQALRVYQLYDMGRCVIKSALQE